MASRSITFRSPSRPTLRLFSSLHTVICDSRSYTPRCIIPFTYLAASETDMLGSIANDSVGMTGHEELYRVREVNILDVPGDLGLTVIATAYRV